MNLTHNSLKSLSFGGVKARTYSQGIISVVSSCQSVTSSLHSTSATQGCLAGAFCVIRMATTHRAILGRTDLWQTLILEKPDLLRILPPDCSPHYSKTKVPRTNLPENPQHPPEYAQQKSVADAAFLLLDLQFEHFCLQLSFWAYSEKMCLTSTSTDCKQRSFQL